MDPLHLRRIRQIAERAAAIEPDRRCTFLDAACGADSELRLEVERLLGVGTPSAMQATEIPETTSTDVPVTKVRGRSIGPYRILRTLGEGGMGTVYQAEQTSPVRRTVALKVIKLGMDTEHVVARFESERQALAMMDHPSIARVLDAGATPDGRPYFVMEYVAGLPITEYCDTNRMPMKHRLRLFIQVCAAVQHAHQKGIIHRDLKPSNILVTAQGDSPSPRIIDFGIAKATSRRLTDKTLFTEVGSFVGTPLYMSPEQFETTAIDVDTRSDVYSLGVVLYELMTGTTPLAPSASALHDVAEIRQRIREEDSPRPSTRITKGGTMELVARARGVDPNTLLREVRGDLDWIVLKALEKDRTRRYSSASELAADIERHLNDEPVVAGPPSKRYRMKKFVRRHRWGVAASTLLVLALCGGIAGTTVGLVRATRAEAAAKRAESEARLEAETAKRTVDFLDTLFEGSDPGKTRGGSITAREILDKGVGKIRVGLDKDPLIQARLMITMGSVYRSLGLYSEARGILSDAVGILRRNVGEDDPRTLDGMNTLVGLLILAGDTDEAARLLDDTLPRVERIFGPEAVETARTLNNRAAMHLKAGHYAEAVPLLARALTIREKTLGSDHPDVAKMLTNLGYVRLNLKDYAGAKRDLERAVAIRTRALGPDHLDTVKPLHNLGLVFKAQGRLAEARDALARVVAVRTRTLGPDHPDTLEVKNELDALGL